MSQKFSFPMALTTEKQNKIAAILFFDHWKTEHQNVENSSVFGMTMFGIQAPTVPLFG